MNKKMSLGEFKYKLKITDATMIDSKYRSFCALVMSGEKLTVIAKKLDRGVSTLGGWMYKAIRNAEYSSRIGRASESVYFSSLNLDEQRKLSTIAKSIAENKYDKAN